MILLQESCVEAQLGIAEPPAASKVVLHLELEVAKYIIV